MENQLDGCISRLNEITNSLAHCTQKLSASTKGFGRLGRLIELKKTHLLLTERELQRERERVGEEVSPLIYSMLAQAEDIVRTKKEERDATELRLASSGEPGTPRSSRHPDPSIPPTPVRGPGKHRLKALQRHREHLEGVLESLDQEHEEVSSQLDRALAERREILKGEAEPAPKRLRTSISDTQRQIQEELEGLEEELRHRREKLQKRRRDQGETWRKRSGNIEYPMHDDEEEEKGKEEDGGRMGEGGTAQQLSKQFFPSPKARRSDQEAAGRRKKGSQWRQPYMILIPLSLLFIDYGRWLRVYLEQNRILEETDKGILLGLSPMDLSAWSQSLQVEQQEMVSVGVK